MNVGVGLIVLEVDLALVEDDTRVAEDAEQRDAPDQDAEQPALEQILAGCQRVRLGRARQLLRLAVGVQVKIIDVDCRD